MPASKKAKDAVKENPNAVLDASNPDHDDIVAATREHQAEVEARRDEGQALVDQGMSITGTGEDEEGFYFLVKNPGASGDTPADKHRPPPPEPGKDRRP